MTDSHFRPQGWSRRSILKVGAGLGAAGLTGLSLGSSAFAADAGLNFMQFIGPNGPSKTQSDWIQKLVDAWNGANDAKITLDYVPDSEYIGGTKLATSFASGQGPDIFLISPGDFLRYYNGGVLADLSPHIDAAAQADFPETVIANRKVDGKIYGVPMEVEPMAFYYSVKAFEDAGLNENDVPKTWDELLEVGKKLTTADRYGLLFETQPGYYQNFTWYPFLWQGGGEFQKADGKSAFDSPATVAALKLWQDAVASGSAPRQALGGGGSDIAANLASGYCAIQNMGIWGISDLANNAPDFKYGVFRLPVPTGGKYVTVGGGWAFVANAKGKNPEAAGKFIAWALASMSKESIDRVVDWCTVAKSDMPPRNSALKAGAAAFDKGVLGVFTREIHPGTRAEPRLPPEVYKMISDAIQGTMLGGADAQQAAATASQQIDAFLASYKGAPLL
ncbi:sugar ABC transporter substrate-binding protein [Kaistia algarum]|uniref:ABC transporter substrate-binding protein n=1 Tax=Kaistia algarum TaxID=2083279 RepID=UPI000CE71E68|nr:sugar ABC transporter substrate-binding protein [Kaistia algarum]MCX5514795.1 sugar ABC transporter substrate-binding protein [Kaistia algarum]PPE79558.1 sugar ABC transporter substrate-binding protein [Kaistia algarum]